MTKPDPSRKLRQDSFCLKTTDAEFLYSLVVNLADSPEDKNAPLWESEILKLVTNYITGERDDTLNQALRLLQASENDDAPELLRLMLEDSSETAPIGRTDEGKAVIGRLFAIPVIAYCPEGLKSSVIPVNAHFNELVASFRNAEVFGDCPIVLTNYLYRPVETTLQWSEKHVLIQDLVLAARAGEYAPIAELGQCEAVEDVVELGSESFTLRYLIGVLATPEGAMPPVFGDEDSETFVESWVQWQNKVPQLLQLTMQDVYPKISFLVGDVYPFHEGLRQGLIEVKATLLYSQVSDVMEDKKLSPAEVKAVVAIYENDDAMCVRTSLLSKSDNQLLAGCEYLIEQSEDEVGAVGVVCSSLDDLGIDSIQIVDEIQPMSACPDCSSPMCLVPDPENRDSFSTQHIHDGGPTLH